MKKSSVVRGIFIVAVVIAVSAGVASSFNWRDLLSGLQKPLEYDDAVAKLGGLMDDVQWREDFVERAETITSQTTSLEDTLPEIRTFPLVVNGRGAGAVTAEIFVSTEKSGSGSDGWMKEAAEAFNKAGKRLPDGREARVSIRKIASGTGYQFIASGKYLPDGYSPSNHLWIRMAEGRGVPMVAVREKTVGNIAGIVMKESVADRFKEQGGALSVARLIDGVVQGQVVTGYTNPFASSTGLNFLVTVLATFAEGDQSHMLSPAVASAFESFQEGIPFIALTTLQMRESVRQDGSLDAFVMEYQTYIKTEELGSGYEFVPFGVPHDNPLYAVGNVPEDKMKVMELFADFMERDQFKNLARSYGFNPRLDHRPAYEVPDGRILIEAQRLWKEKKDAGRPIVAVFVSDVSGSMDGSRIQQLKKALLEGSAFIAPENSIGLVEFDDNVRVILPIKPFSLLHKSAFHAAVRQMRAGGGTAMYDGIAVAMSMIAAERARNDDAKFMIFVLTDGETNEGLSFSKVNRVIEGLGVPIYTIGFEADLDELGRLSALVEAASLKAGEENLRYKIGSLLNSQM